VQKPGFNTCLLAHVLLCPVMVLLVVASVVAAVAIGLWHLTRNSRKQWKVFVRIAAVALMSISTLAVLLFLLGSAMSGHYDFDPVASSDGRLMAQVSEEDCGATDSFHSSVQLWRYKQGILSKLFGKRDHSQTVFTLGHDPRLVKLEWKSVKTLLIHYPDDSRSAGEFRCQSQ
jgi:hypothetical protein